MSVLSVPRIFFSGRVSWDPDTTNNNDQWQTYDYPKAELNWDWLAQNSPVTQENFQTEFPKWAQTLKEYTNTGGTPPSWKQPPAEWNYYGGNDVVFHSTGDEPFYTKVTGGQTALGGDIDTGDGLVGAAVGIRGDSYPWAPNGNPTKARMVDVNPGCFWSTQVYLKDFVLANLDGSSEPRPSYLEGPAVADSRIHLRWMNVQRNLGSYPDVEIAGGAAVVGQICLPTSGLTITPPAAGSGLLAAVQTGLDDTGVKGVMVRFCAYLTRYFSKSEFDGCDGYAEQYAKLAQLWAQALASGQNPIQNPAMSHLVGTVGLWSEGELQTMPGGRYLWPVGSAQPSNAGAAVPLGPVAGELQKDSKTGDNYLSLDFGNCIPEINSSAAKADFGDLVVKLTDNTTPIGTLTSSQYDQASYEASAGIVDLKLPSAISSSDVTAGAILVEAGVTTLLSERADKLSVQTDQRGVYVDQKKTGSIELQVHQNGVAPTVPVNVLVTQYLQDPPAPKGAGSWILGTASPVVHFDNDQPEMTLTVNPGDNGCASVTVSALDGPGFPNIVFFPYLQGTAAPKPPPSIVPVYTDPSVPSITTAFFSCVRVLPFDNKLPLELALLWARSKNKDLAWKYVYTRVLYLYDMVYPVMKYYAQLDLGSQSVVDQRIGQIVILIDEAMLNNTLYMPVTRELSAGKRAVLEMYAILQASDFTLDKLEVPKGFPTSED